MRKIKTIAAAMAVTVLMAGCGETKADDKVTPSATLKPTETLTQTPDVSVNPTAEESIPLEEVGQEVEGAVTEEMLKALARDEYDGLEMTAEILQRSATLPGSVVPVTVLIKNTGDKTIAYTHGSGSFETPQSLYTNMHGLQVVKPKDHLGVMTMDMQTKHLKPGEELKYVVNVMAIEPNAKFHDYSFDMHSKDGAYIAETPFDELFETHNDLVAAKPGSYDGSVYFLYSVMDENAGIDLAFKNTGYVQADFKITVND